MISLLDNVTVFHNQDQVCILDGRKSVRDHKACSALHQIVHGFLDTHFGSGIYRGGCLIQDQNLIIGKDCPGNSEKLFLSLGNITGFFIQNHVIACMIKLCTWAAFAAAITSSSVASRRP